TLKAEINNEWNQLPSSLAVKLAASIKKRIEALIESNENFAITSYKVSEKLTVIQEAKQIGVLAALHRFGIDQSMLNKLRQMEIAITSGIRIPSNLPCGIVVYMHESAWMDENLMSEWIDQVWNKRPETSIVNKPLSLLVMDLFERHLTDIVKNKCAVNNIHKAIILGEAWDDISAEMIIKSFKKYGISNELDETEDDLLYNSDQENSEINNNEDLFEVVEEDSLSAKELED
ncbi:20864_t:CDS:2, partial [Cetraspora pellucida]